MRVGIYANIASPSAWGGSAHVLLSLLGALGKHAPSDVEFVVFGPNGDTEWLAPALSGNMRLAVPTIKQGGFVWRKSNQYSRVVRNFLSRRPRLSRYFEPLTNGYYRKELSDLNAKPCVSTGFIESEDVNVIHFPFQEFVVTSRPSIFNPHDLQHIHLPGFWSPDEILYREVFYRFACNCATKVAAAFPWVGSDLVDNFGIPKSKVVVIPWGIATSLRPRPSPEDIQRVRDDYGLPASFAFYPASPWPHKNHVSLIKAAKILRQRGVDLPVVLSGGENLYNASAWAQLRSLSRDLSLGDAVRFIGYVNTDDMRAIYRSASMIVVPTLFEAGSGPVAEAWNDETPATCSNIPMLRGQAEDAALFFDPHNPDSIANAMQSVLEDHRLREKLVEAGKERAAFYSWERSALGYISLYRELAQRSASAPG